MKAAEECGSVLCKGGEVVAAFLDDQRWQAERTNGCTEAAKAFRRHIHLRLRIFAIDVEAE